MDDRKGRLYCFDAFLRSWVGILVVLNHPISRIANLTYTCYTSIYTNFMHRNAIRNGRNPFFFCFLERERGSVHCLTDFFSYSGYIYTHTHHCPNHDRLNKRPPIYSAVTAISLFLKRGKRPPNSSTIITQTPNKQQSRPSTMPLSPQRKEEEERTLGQRGKAHFTHASPRLSNTIQ